ncbi:MULTISPECIES: Hsp70 family protein [unclassified Streptomyces]|uniref:Hsp70 family protein n=1 Tax=unclassified Streptomyces TaxID=2593676 RepID=UPI002E79A9E4|nr:MULTISPECIES: Hsp70 family protein [unclassified Streptomyces]MEE1766410.1 Hsp70 family protein [Streptomyces sp. SP18BB07]MEE1837029.1 Hsp70 family protein [Streptomyces sp. SP17KL33]
MARVVGIDLGTKGAIVAALDGTAETWRKPFVVPNAEGSGITPSLVAFTADDMTLIGEAARRQAVADVSGTVSRVKQHMGTGRIYVHGGRTHRASGITALLLAKLKRDAETYLDEEVTGAVVTVPTHFSHAARLAVKEAGALAGLPVLRLLNEPTAAALFDGINRDDEVVLVVHCGGGTFAFSLVEVGDGVVEVKASRGDARLGGDDWDRETAGHLAARFRELHGMDPAADPTSLRRLCEAAENAKIELSSAPEATIEVPCVAMSAAGPLHLRDRLSRDEFLHVTRPLLDRCGAALAEVFAAVGISVSEVSRVVMTGGATRMPSVLSLVRNHFGDHTPIVVTQPGEAVAYGAALQAGVLTGIVRDALVLEVTSHSLGVATRGGVMRTLIARDTTLPTLRSELFTPARDGDAEDCAVVRIPVYEGESDNAADNALIGLLDLPDLPAAARGRAADIDVRLDVDHDALVRLSATNHATGTTWSRTPEGTCEAERTRVRPEPARKPSTVWPTSTADPQSIIAPDSLARTLLAVLLGILIALAFFGGIFWALL